MSTSIVKCGIDDVNELSKISRTTFTQTFFDTNTEEDLNEFLQNAYNVETLTQQLLNKNSKFYFYYYENKLAGYLKLNVEDAQTEQASSNDLEIERIYILNEFKGKGIGTKLIEFSIEKAKTANKNRVWLGVWEHNASALKFYSKMGFEVIGSHTFNVGSDAQIDLIMEKAIK